MESKLTRPLDFLEVKLSFIDVTLDIIPVSLDNTLFGNVELTSLEVGGLV